TNCAAMGHLPTTVVGTVLSYTRVKADCRSPRLRSTDAISRYINLLPLPSHNQSSSATKVSQVNRSRSIFQSARNRRRRLLSPLCFLRPLLHRRNQPAPQSFFELSRYRHVKCCAGIDLHGFSFRCFENQSHGPATRRGREQRPNLSQFIGTCIRRKMQTKRRRLNAVRVWITRNFQRKKTQFFRRRAQ